MSLKTVGLSAVAIALIAVSFFVPLAWLGPVLLANFVTGLFLGNSIAEDIWGE
ncbi:hypothetical protein R2325_16660 [Mycobacteroides chelonae]|uniref:hypothetical protein n=1 Tax=Mycobacteroides chelonae TaxID=1774 RepID=UPI002DF029D7|nr:hypothetical protein [Mycobacteroides chelonae]MEC4873617.1 hypothetical protein [Mycobacteroides chelonae]